VYELVLTLHVLAVVVAFGTVFAYPVLIGLLGGTPAFHRAAEVLWSRLVTPAMVVVLLAGAYLATDRGAWAEPWVSASLVILFVLFGITGAFFGPQERRAAELAVRGGPQYDEVAQRLRLGALAAALLVVAAVVLMVVQPG
jgi:uncharacterized membrane protein